MPRRAHCSVVMPRFARSSSHERIGTLRHWVYRWFDGRMALRAMMKPVIEVAFCDGCGKHLDDHPWIEGDDNLIYDPATNSAALGSKADHGKNV